MDNFVTLVVVKEFLDTFGDKELYALTGMLSGLLLMNLGIKTRMSQIQNLVIKTLDGIQRQVDRLRNFPADITKCFSDLTLFHIIVERRGQFNPKFSSIFSMSCQRRILMWNVFFA